MVVSPKVDLQIFQRWTREQEGGQFRLGNGSRMQPYTSQVWKLRVIGADHWPGDTRRLVMKVK